MSPDTAALRVDEVYLRDVLTRLVQSPSINPFFDSTSPGERDVAEVVARECEHLDMTVTRFETEPGRVSIVGRRPGSGRGRSLMLYAHHDTVGVAGMPEPFSARIEDGKMYGRGAYDMKGGLAACFAAVHALRERGLALAGDVVLVAVADEEVASIGMMDVLRHVHTDAAIVTEATELALCTAHKGFSWIEVETHGRAAHGSRFHEGIDANMRMGRFLSRLEHLEVALRQSTPHPLVGPPSLHAGILRGGAGPSIYAANCHLEIERRMLPHETESLVVNQIKQIADELAAEDDSFRATVRPMLTRPAFEVDPQAPIVSAVRRAATRILGAEPASFGAPYWMDASLIAQQGTETVVFGPTGTGAHADVEWVDLDSVAVVGSVLANAAAEYCA